MEASYLGYRTAVLTLPAPTDTFVMVELEPEEIGLDGVEVSSESGGHRRNDVKVSPDEIRSVPSIGGEPDLVKAIQLMPGVQGGREGSAGLFVRGGTPDQNLILLDGTPVYNATHLLGFLSTFNPDVVRAADLIKGPGPARYGGRLSSVLDVSMLEGNPDEHQTRGSVGLVSARGLAEGPVGIGRAAYLVAARRTYADLLWRLFQPPDEQGGYHFYDVVAKVSAVGERSGAVLSLYGGRDLFWTEYETELGGGYPEQYDGGLGWGNLTGTLRWFGQLSPRLLVETSVGATRYALSFEEETLQGEPGTSEEELSRSTYQNGVTDWLGSASAELALSPRHRLTFGAQAVHHRFRPSVSSVTERWGEAPAVTRRLGQGENVRGHSLSGHVEDAFEVGPLSGSLGLRATWFASGGASYLSAEPRVYVGWDVDARTHVRASYTTATQPVHLISRSGVGIPLDLWLPSTRRVAPQRAWQTGVGVSREVWSRHAEVSLDLFYKAVSGILSPAEGSALLGVDAVGWEDRVQIGSGKAYGAEALVRKRAGALTGWVAYTLSRAELRFPAFDAGQPFPSPFDRLHDLAITGAYAAGRGWVLSGTWVFGSGEAAWLPIARSVSIEDDAGYDSEPGYEPGVDAYVYGPRNGVRAPAYHRLDIAAQHSRETRWGRRTWTLGLYNAYGRRNPFFLYPKTTSDGRYEVRQASPLAFIPALSYAFEFR